MGVLHLISYTQYVTIPPVNYIALYFCIDGPSRPISIDFNKPTVEVMTFVQMTCNMDDVGNPSATKYDWFKDGELFILTSISSITLYPTNVNYEGNYTCRATNEPQGYDPITTDASPHTPLSITGKHSLCKL